MISKSYMTWVSQVAHQRQQAQEERDRQAKSEVISLHTFEHIGIDTYKTPRQEIDAKVGDNIQVEFVHRWMRSSTGGYITHKMRVFAQDNDFTYIKIY